MDVGDPPAADKEYTIFWTNDGAVRTKRKLEIGIDSVSSNNHTEKTKTLNVGHATFNQYKESIKLQAEDSVLNKFPDRVLELEAVLNTTNFQIGDPPAVDKELPSYITFCANDGAVRKKRKLEVGIDSVSSNNNTEKIILCNNHISDIVEMIKLYIRQLLEDIQPVKTWLQFLTPRYEDNNDLMESLLDNIFNDVQTAENNAEAYSNQISAYFLTRGKIITKVVKYPQIEDYKRSVHEMDEKFLCNMRLTLHELKNDYEILHDKFTKNLKNIKKSRNFDPTTMY